MLEGRFAQFHTQVKEVIQTTKVPSNKRQRRLLTVRKAMVRYRSKHSDFLPIYNAIRKRSVYEERKSKGLCVDCSVKVEGIRCYSCRYKQRLWNREYRKRIKCSTKGIVN